jgi:hypothetical protein
VFSVSHEDVYYLTKSIIIFVIVVVSIFVITITSITHNNLVSSFPLCIRLEAGTIGVKHRHIPPSHC